jgi:hypothetical protein
MKKVHNSERIKRTTVSVDAATLALTLNPVYEDKRSKFYAPIEVKFKYPYRPEKEICV